jgi:hypothetical protein
LGLKQIRKGTTLIIRLNKITPDKIADQYPAVHIWGTRIDNGEEWDKMFFENNQKLQEQLSEFGIGDVINVRMVQKGKNWNIVSLEEADPDMVEAIKGRGSDPIGGSPGAKPNATNVQKNSGRSSWNGRTGEAYDRSASVYLAFDMIKATRTEAALHKFADEELAKMIIDWAEVLNDYIHDGVNHYAVTDDPLDPPF